MQRNRLFWTVALGLILSLLMIVVPAKPALAAEKVTLTPDSGAVGSTITVTGDGFTADTEGWVWFDSNKNGSRDTGEPQVSVKTVADKLPSGVTLDVPAVAAGTYKVRADIPAGGTVEAEASFTVKRQITLSPTSGCVGDTVTVNGTGFKASSDVKIYFDSTNVKTATSDANGGFSNATFTVPESYAGNHPVKGKDADGESATVNFTIKPKLTLTSTSGAVGDTVTVSGTGFKASSDVTIYFDSTDLETAQTDAKGSFPNTNITIPSASRGSHTIKAEDASNNYATATFTLAQKITISPTSGAPGMTVTVNGSGFGASKRVTIKYKGAAVTTNPATVNTDVSGSFTASFTVPPSDPGSYAVEASDGTYTASTNFTITINITLDKVTSAASPGYVGMEITVSGTGFKPNSQIRITYTSKPIVVATITSDSQGAFSATFKIPKSEHGPHTIAASDGTSTLETTFFMEETPPAVPRLLEPLGGTKAKSRAVFDWGDVTKDVNDAGELSRPITYDLQIALDADFDNIVLEKTELSTSGYTLLKGEKLESTDKEAPYYWRVRAVDAASNAGDWTKSRTFYVSGLDWLLYCLIGAGVLLVFFLGFGAGRASKRSGYY